MLLIYLPACMCWRFAFGDPQEPTKASLTDWRGVWHVQELAEAERLLAEAGCRLTRTGEDGRELLAGVFRIVAE